MTIHSSLLKFWQKWNRSLNQVFGRLRRWEAKPHRDLKHLEDLRCKHFHLYL